MNLGDNSDDATKRRLKCVAKKLRPLTEDNGVLVQEMLNTLSQKETLSQAETGTLIKTLQRIPSNENIVREVDAGKQMNIVQWAVVRNSHQLLEALLSRDGGICLNCWSCDAPLHLACKFG